MQLPNVHNIDDKSQVRVMMEKQIGAFEARRSFGQILEEAYYNKDAFIVTRSGREMAAIISIEDYRKWQKLAKEMAMQMIREVRERNQQVPLEEIEADIDAALEALQSDAGSEDQPAHV
jgi:prevent-host-death family protein